MSEEFRIPAVEQALSLELVDWLIDQHRNEGLRLARTNGRYLAHNGDPAVIVSALLQRARFGLLLRDLANAEPAKQLGTAVRAANQRIAKER